MKKLVLFVLVLFFGMHSYAMQGTHVVPVLERFSASTRMGDEWTQGILLPGQLIANQPVLHVLHDGPPVYHEPIIFEQDGDEGSCCCSMTRCKRGLDAQFLNPLVCWCCLDKRGRSLPVVCGALCCLHCSNDCSQFQQLDAVSDDDYRFCSPYIVGEEMVLLGLCLAAAVASL